MFVFNHAQGITTVHAGREGVRKWQNSVHVVVEWPLSNNNFTVTFTRCNVAFEMVIMYYHGLDFF